VIRLALQFDRADRRMLAQSRREPGQQNPAHLVRILGNAALVVQRRLYLAAVPPASNLRRHPDRSRRRPRHDIVLVQREMECGGSLLASIARAATGREASNNCSTSQPRMRSKHYGWQRPRLRRDSKDLA